MISFRQKADFWIALVAGTIEALLLARLVLQLFAARPSNPVVAALLWLTEPLTALLAGLDAGQPTFGARLEISTVLGCVLVALFWWLGTRLARRVSSHLV